MTNRFYVTTAIDYPNGTPHMGHAYEKIVADAYARWNRLLKNETHYLTGTDENGQKLIESAQAAGKETAAFVDEQVLKFKELISKLEISNTDFIRTTEKRHADVCQNFWTRLQEKGQVYAGKYSGMYCMGCESFYTELQAPDGNCPEHHKPLQKKEEEGYFFKLSEYSDWIIDHLKANPTFVTPRGKYNEILSRLESEPLRDLAISRPNQGWGVEVPGDNNFVMYTWFDALINYYSALSPEQKEFWPADMHVIGKDILWFHAVIWPCMLKALDIPLPKKVYVHGMILAEDGKKMSKSLGNGVDPMDMIAKYPVDSFRYYLLRSISALSDGAFSEKDLIQKHNSELGNDFGNLIMRVVKLSLKAIDPKISGAGVTQELNFDETYSKMKELMEACEHNKALDVLWESVNSINQYVNDKEPWKLKEDPAALTPVIYNCLYGIHATSSLLSAFLPETSKNALVPLSVEVQSFEDIKFGEVEYNLLMPEPLFPKIEK